VHLILSATGSGRRHPWVRRSETMRAGQGECDGIESVSVRRLEVERAG
jgi:hypothetical protein